MAAAVAVLGLTLAGPAAAQYTLPPDNSGADQYVAPVPGPGGNTPSSPGPGHPGSLPPGVRDSLPPGSEGKLLARIATDPGSGAPVGVSGQTAAGGNGSSGGGQSSSGGSSSPAPGHGASGHGASVHETGASPASAITNAVSNDGGVGILAAGLLVLTLGVAALGLLQRRRRHV